MKKAKFTAAKHGDAALAAPAAEDFLPPPSQLVKRARKEKITIALDSFTLDFFKRQAKLQKTKYQTMINEVLGRYARHYSR